MNNINIFSHFTRLLPIFLLGCFMNENVYARKPAAAGTFYPADRNELIDFVDKAMAGKKNQNIGTITAMVVPHAGYIFSGKIAGRAYKNINDSYDTVIIAGTGHTQAVKGADMLIRDDYQTPLGVIPTDRELAYTLSAIEPLFTENANAHLSEHSIEVQLPFLQRRLKKPFKLLAMTLNYADDKAVKKMAEALAKTIKDKKILLIISTDLSHYTDTVNAKYSDETFAAALKTMNSDFIRKTSEIILSKKIKGLETCACGETAVLFGMETAKLLGAKSFKSLEISDSYRQYPQSKSSSRVVGYMSGYFVKSGKAPSNGLNKKNKRFLLEQARLTLQNYFDKKQDYSLAEDAVYNLPAASFVTLTIDGKLRGCVGTVQPVLTLLDSVRYGAYSAAFSDTRFMPLRAEELNKIKIEISVLSPLNLTKEEEIIPKKHGVMVKNKEHSGLFLPQVWAQIPDKDSFMGELCQQKSGLPRDCWKSQNIEIYTFTVDSFEEGERTVLNNK